MEEVPPEEKRMELLDHLEELRRRLITCIVATFLCAIIGYFLSQFILNALSKPVGELVFLAPPEAFITRLKISLIIGVFLAIPIIFYQFWQFVAPGLLKRERKYVFLTVLSSTIFFLGGAVFAYFVVLPLAIGFFLSFQTESLKAMFSIERYVGFVAKLLLAFGIAFQLPVVSFFLTKMGIVSPDFLRKRWRVAFVLVFIASAVFTPPDVFTQLLMAVPLLLLFGISILVSALAARGRPASEEAEEPS